VKVKIPYADMLRLATKIVRYSRGGFTLDEISDLVADLLDLATLLTQLETAMTGLEAEKVEHEGDDVR
jgi:hypothetical protein